MFANINSVVQYGRTQSALFGGVALSALLGLAGCGADANGNMAESSGVEIGTQVEAVTTGTAGWRHWGPEPTNASGWAGGPALCSAMTTSGDGYVEVGRDAATNRFSIVLRQFFTAATNPVNISSTHIFASKPTCANLDQLHQLPDSMWNNQIAVLGRRSSTGPSNNQFFIKVMKLDTEPAFFGDPPSQPTEVLPWSSISTNVYASAPAATVSAAWMMVVGRKSDNRLYLHRNHLFILLPLTPLDNTTWEPVVQVPALPAGWTAVGDPAIADTTPLYNLTTIATRAQSGGVSRIFYITFDPAAVTFGAWQQPSTAGLTVQSDPALEVDLGLGLLTIYFRADHPTFPVSTNHIYQGSGYANTTWQVFSQVVDADGDDTFIDSPAALGNLMLEGHHVVAAKKSTNQFWQNSTNVGIQ
jgi:hypothetical protein